MDAAGKDSVISHVMSGVNPQGCQVYSFKAPSPEELDHDYFGGLAAVCRSEGGLGFLTVILRRGPGGTRPS